ncbi:tyrosine-type recombinase/integrase [Paracoccus sp. (in: a-proteobacteria)]|uniref:tyrosine-type recombinase/integrase n=1 Tax=Paracoccus sp. TaxID=267 RepID=UPI0034CF4116
MYSSFAAHSSCSESQACKAIPTAVSDPWISYRRRKESLLSLRWRDVDLQAGFIHWNPQDRISTKKERPPGAIPPRLHKYLRRQRARFPHDDFVISSRGAPLKDIKTAFASLMRLYLAVEQHRSASDIGSRFTVTDRAYPHLLRHSCATWLMQKGVKPAAAASFLGMSEETLYRRYYHHHPEFQREAANAF